MKSSGIGGQAVIEGVMMKNKDRYAVAVRKPDNEIEVVVKECSSPAEKHRFLGWPVIRGVVNFIDSLVIGMSTLSYSASFYEDDEPDDDAETKGKKKQKTREQEAKEEKAMMTFTVILSIVMAVAVFMIAPYYVSRLFALFVKNDTAVIIIEGIVRLVFFIIYVKLISLMNDIKRVYMYHGAEHKCINCIEHGMELTVENVLKSSKEHKRCGTSFLLIVMCISIDCIIRLVGNRREHKYLLPVLHRLSSLEKSPYSVLIVCPIYIHIRTKLLHAPFPEGCCDSGMYLLVRKPDTIIFLRKPCKCRRRKR